MPSAPDFVLEACEVLSFDCIHLTPELLRRAKRNEINDDTYEEERCALLEVICKLLHINHDNTSSNNDRNIIELIDRALQECNYPRHHLWNISSREQLFCISYLAIHTQRWRDWSVETVMKMDDMSGCMNTKMDIIKASIINKQQQQVQHIDNDNSDTNNNSSSSNSSNSNRANRPNLKGSPSRSQAPEISIQTDLIAQPLIDSSSSSSSDNDSNNNTAQNMMIRYNRIQSKLRLLKSLDKKRSKLLSSLLVLESQFDDTGGSGSGGGGRKNKNIDNILQVIKLAKKAHDNKNTTIGNSSSSNDNGSDDNNDIHTIIKDYRHSHTQLLNFIDTSHSRESKFWNWIKTAADENTLDNDSDKYNNNDDGNDDDNDNDTNIAINQKLESIKNKGIEILPHFASLEEGVLGLLSHGSINSSSGSSSGSGSGIDNNSGGNSNNILQICDEVRQELYHLGINTNTNKNSISGSIGSSSSSSSSDSISFKILQQYFSIPPLPISSSLLSLRSTNRNIIERALSASEQSCPYSMKSMSPGKTYK